MRYRMNSEKSTVTICRMILSRSLLASDFIPFFLSVIECRIHLSVFGNIIPFFLSACQETVQLLIGVRKDLQGLLLAVGQELLLILRNILFSI